ncbi:MAG: hypothetical protein P8Q94_07270, partial [Candidatus Poseidoniaceae archaeon]|nr:hypothetical protein [Candidatus Poseidoniaceae archaeon]
MQKISKTVLLTFLMIILGLSAATNSLNESTETTSLDDVSAPQEVIRSLSSLNVPGHQEGSIYTEATISAGAYNTCAILDNSLYTGTASCWGDGFTNALANGGTTSTSVPTETDDFGLRSPVSISVGYQHGCAILDDGSVSCWGAGNVGQIGNGLGGQGGSDPSLTRLSPEPTSGFGQGRTAVAISAGSAHTCAILNTGEVSCWGYGDAGRLGHGSTSSMNIPTETASLSPHQAIAISAGYDHTCAILDNGEVSCWGMNNYGQLGDGTTINRNIPTQIQVSLGSKAVAISAGVRHTCAILDNGEVYCWGDNQYGQLGDGNEGFDSASPIPTLTLGTNRDAIAISAGRDHTCVILDNGDVSCWGNSGFGALGNGDDADNIYSSPTLTNSLGTTANPRTAVAIDAGWYHTCVILDNGDLSCWGFSNAATGSSSTPNLVTNLGTNSNPQTVALAEGDFDDDGILNIFESIQPSLVSCSAGQYGFYLCVDAPAGKYVQLGTARYADNCLAGTYNTNTGSTASSDCIDADEGHYVERTGQASQTACLAGTYNPGTGSTASSDCVVADAGHYVDQPGQSSQTACLAGTYQADTGQDDCDIADAGHYVDQTGQSSQTACLAGTYNPNTGSTASTDCIVADAGHYVDLALGVGQSSQTACLAGTFNPYIGSFNSTYCLVADAGYYVEQPGQPSQTACLAGTYQADTGQDDCDDADAGYYVPLNGQSSQIACSAGTFQSSTGSYYCDDAEVGYYVDLTGQSTQVQCSPGYTTITTRSTTPYQCLSDYDGDTIIDVFDSDDDDDG